MSTVPERLESLIEGELAELSDKRVLSHIRGMLVAPHMVLRDWDYGQPGEQYPCWFVLRDAQSGAEIAYCEHGFGPGCPWGLVSSAHEPEFRHMGMDSGWFTSFLDAFFDSFACVALLIWKVINIDADGTRTCLTAEGAWESTWQRVYELRNHDPSGRYECGHDIGYRKTAT
ncbi:MULTISPECIES: hypothetical protein [unclassified Bradyrhizobium]|uniref:hypothetical protein n=1 Tax=Bradyrhizobium TaxID=374 RepID=UPI0028F05F56|nr:MULTISPECIES: hypothetical protein [unclassified Bradyrhizobium]